MLENDQKIRFVRKHLKEAENRLKPRNQPTELSSERSNEIHLRLWIEIARSVEPSRFFLRKFTSTWGKSDVWKKYDRPYWTRKKTFFENFKNQNISFGLSFNFLVYGFSIRKRKLKIWTKSVKKGLFWPIFGLFLDTWPYGG